MNDYENALNKVVETDYTSSSWSDYQLIVDANQVTISDTQDDVDSATQAIEVAQSSLIAKSGDLTNYNDAIDLEIDNEALYTVGSWSDYESILLNNVVTVGNLQSEIDNATQNILDAQDSVLVLV